MRTSRLSGIGLLLVAMILTGCKKNDLKEENALLNEEVQSLRDMLDERNMALDSCNQELRNAQARNADLQSQLSGGMGGSTQTGFENIPGVSGSVGGGMVTASVESDVLFSSGKASLKSSAKQSLDAVATVLNSTYAGNTIQVAGHTDTDPIKKSGYKSNYHLGFERAFAVRDYLISRGVSADRLYLASYGPDMPMGSKDQSRRVEINVILSN